MDTGHHILKTDILQQIGNTPIMQISDGILAKAEYTNPSGSIKARMAHFMIEKAEAAGLLKPGDTIVEATSGNTGNAMSMVAAVKGYKMLVLIPDGYTNERTLISLGFGADIRYVGHFQVGEAREEALRIGKQDGFYCPAQFDNEWNVEENRDWLGQEIVAQLNELDIKIDAIVQGVGTGGTLIGNAIALKEHHNPDLKVFAMEPTESQTLACCMVADHKIEGISDGFVPTIYARYRHLVDDVISVDSNIAIEETKKLCAKQGLFVGPSSGANYYAAKQIKEKHPEIKNVLTFLCDRGEKYLSMLFKEEKR